ncbi:4-vinyl reductase 4VR [Methanocaldococcus vulcanius M7]|uniref:4-vinyl reductase 4VR n=1 Tax=Methanocaldococcus vulcanius (strain ATCC 700851 / DSM 12094 / M7) TaxID=579137 RepID=C9RGX5_METVM|nr:V4R domain-containing protein [Methanocaldococcus vulcanius]ACX72827.1 4-vinyl reductase 4VR [Methanocaldococcus vulcanius M7]
MDKELLHKKVKKDLENLINDNPPERTLGNLIPLSIFQAVRIGVLTTGCGIEAIIYNIGKDIGREVISKYVDESNLFESFADILSKAKIGVLEVKKIDENEMILVLKDCISCHNVPNVGTTLCHFEAGLIAGTLEEKLKRKVNVVETKCCGKGDEYCEFLVKVEEKIYW